MQTLLSFQKTIEFNVAMCLNLIDKPNVLHLKDCT